MDPIWATEKSSLETGKAPASKIFGSGNSGPKKGSGNAPSAKGPIKIPTPISASTEGILRYLLATKPANLAAINITPIWIKSTVTMCVMFEAPPPDAARLLIVLVNKLSVSMSIPKRLKVICNERYCSKYI